LFNLYAVRRDHALVIACRCKGEKKAVIDRVQDPRRVNRDQELFPSKSNSTSDNGCRSIVKRPTKWMMRVFRLEATMESWKEEMVPDLL